MAFISPDIPGVTDVDILYHYRLGVFHAVWSTVDAEIDMSIGQFLGLPDIDTILLTWGMMFGAKAKLLGSLIKRSEHPQKQALQTALNGLRSDAKRDVLAHAYQFGGQTEVGFLERSRGNSGFNTKMHRFTHDAFREHVSSVIRHANAYQAAIGFSHADAQRFADAARSLESKS